MTARLIITLALVLATALAHGQEKDPWRPAAADEIEKQFGVIEAQRHDTKQAIELVVKAIANDRQKQQALQDQHTQQQRTIESLQAQLKAAEQRIEDQEMQARQLAPALAILMAISQSVEADPGVVLIGRDQLKHNVITPPNGQHLIPRYHKDGQYPAGPTLPGIYRATSQTKNNDVPAIIATEDAHLNVGQWTSGNSGSDNLVPAVVGVVIRDAIADGTSIVPNTQQNNLHNWADSNGGFDGYRLKGNGVYVNRVTAVRIPGTGLVVSRPSSDRVGQVQRYDSTAVVCDNVDVQYAIRGINFNAVDGQLSHAFAHGIYEYGIRLGGAGSSHDLHIWGRFGSGDGVGVLFDGGNHQSARIYSENVKTGVKFTGSNNTITDLYTHTCSQEDVWFAGSFNAILGGRMRSRAVGVRMANQYNAVSNVRIDAALNNAVCVQMTNGKGQVLDKVRCVMNSVSGAKGVVVNATLNDSTIDIHCIGGAACIEFGTGGGIGSRNRIRIRDDGSATTFINRPTTWNSTNVIEVNGSVVASGS